MSRGVVMVAVAVVALVPGMVAGGVGKDDDSTEEGEDGLEVGRSGEREILLREGVVGRGW